MATKSTTKGKSPRKKQSTSKRGRPTKKEQKRTTLDEINQMFKEVFVDSKVSMFVYGDAKKDDLPTKVEFNKLFNKNN